jgi:hypothetical protein
LTKALNCFLGQYKHRSVAKQQVLGFTRLKCRHLNGFSLSNAERCFSISFLDTYCL